MKLLVNNLDNWYYSELTLANLGKFHSAAITELWDITPANYPNVRCYRLYDLMCKNTWDTDWITPGDTRYMQTPLTKAMIDDNDWWLRDGVTNEVITENATIWYLDVGKTGFKEAYLSSILGRLRGKGFLGLVFDYWHYTLQWIIGEHTRPDAYPDDEYWWNDAWKPFIDYVMAGIHDEGYLIIGNCAGEYNSGDEKADYQRSLLDGTIYEQWAMGWTGGWLPTSVVDARLSSARNDPLEVWSVDFGLRSHFADVKRMELLGLAMHYISLLPTKLPYRSYHYYGDSFTFWSDLWDKDMGEPVAEAQKLADGVYYREFTRGWVGLNYNPVNNTINGAVFPPYTGRLVGWAPDEVNNAGSWNKVKKYLSF